MKKYVYENRKDNIDGALNFVYDSLIEYKIPLTNRDEDLAFLEALLRFIEREHKESSEITIQINKRLGETTLQLFYKGKKLELDRAFETELDLNNDGVIDEVERQRYLELFENHFLPKNFNQKYDGELNTLSFIIKKLQHKTLIELLVSLVLGTVTGILIRSFASASVASFLSKNVFLLLSGIFIKCIKTLIAPLIFFTIASSISSYTDLGSLGRMGRKISTRYIIDAFVAVIVSAFLVIKFKPGVGNDIPKIESLINSSSDIVDTASTTTISIFETISDIFPSNFFGAFVNSSLLQVIFISFLLGISTALLAETHKERLCSFLDSGNSLFAKMVSIVMLFLPISVFCSMANAMITLGYDTLLLLLKWFVILVAAFAIMALVYILFIWRSVKIRPSQYLKQYSQAIIGTFAMGSSSSAMPLCIQVLEEKLGVDKRAAAFSIPIGTSLHCASNCVFYVISAFFLANIYSPVEMMPLDNLMILFSIMILSIGAPSVSGAGPICVAVILSQMGMPMGLISLIIGLDPLVSMFKSACSCIEDSYVTLALAKSENMLHRTD